MNIWKNMHKRSNTSTSITILLFNIAMENHHAFKNGTVNHLFLWAIEKPWRTVSHNQMVNHHINSPIAPFTVSPLIPSHSHVLPRSAIMVQSFLFQTICKIIIIIIISSSTISLFNHLDRLCI